MGLSLDSIYAPLNEFFLSHFETGAGSSILFRFDKFGSVLSDQDFIDPNHPNLGYVPGLARERFSDLVNHIPADSHDGLNIVFCQNSIDEVYYYHWLAPAIPYTAAATDAESKDSIIRCFSLIKADAIKVWTSTKLESSQGLMLEYKPSLATPEDWYDKSKSDAWAAQSFQASETSPSPAAGQPADQLWKLRPSDAALQTVVQVPPKPMLAARGVAPGTESGPPGKAVPPSAAMSLSALHDSYHTLDVGQRIVANQYFANNAPTRSTTTDSISISFDYCMVRARRPWCVDVFLNDKTWFIPSVAKGQLTSSAGDGNLSFMPIGFVAIRNLNIEANWSADDIAAATTATHFGPFKVSPQIVNNKLSHVGLQIVGWLLQKMPDLPPNDTSVKPPAPAPAPAPAPQPAAPPSPPPSSAVERSTR